MVDDFRIIHDVWRYTYYIECIQLKMLFEPPTTRIRIKSPPTWKNRSKSVVYPLDPKLTSKQIEGLNTLPYSLFIELEMSILYLRYRENLGKNTLSSVRSRIVVIFYIIVILFDGEIDKGLSTRVNSEKVYTTGNIKDYMKRIKVYRPLLNTTY